MKSINQSKIFSYFLFCSALQRVIFIFFKQMKLTSKFLFNILSYHYLTHSTNRHKVILYVRKKKSLEGDFQKKSVTFSTIIIFFILQSVLMGISIFVFVLNEQFTDILSTFLTLAMVFCLLKSFVDCFKVFYKKK